MSRPSRKKVLLWSVLAFSLVVSAGKWLFIGYYKIPQNGMYPGLPAGSTLLTAKQAYEDASEVQRGDIIVFFREVNGYRTNYIWRVVGLPGERVDAVGDRLLINGKPVQRQHLREEDDRAIYREQIGDTSYEVAFKAPPHHRPPRTSIRVPSDAFFVMGDNRFDAHDSRYFGTVPFSSILGRKL